MQECIVHDVARMSFLIFWRRLFFFRYRILRRFAELPPPRRPRSPDFVEKLRFGKDASEFRNAVLKRGSQERGSCKPRLQNGQSAGENSPKSLSGGHPPSFSTESPQLRHQTDPRRTTGDDWSRSSRHERRLSGRRRRRVASESPTLYSTRRMMLHLSIPAQKRSASRRDFGRSGGALSRVLHI